MYNVENVSQDKHKNLLNQIDISNNLSKNSILDLVTMPIDKSILKRYITFVGMTEYLGKINLKNTNMLMHGDKFSVIPLTTHINLKDIYKYIEKKIFKVY